MASVRRLTIAGFLVLALPSLAQEPVELQEARAEYGNGAQTESTRSSYITKLVRMRERMAASHDKAWQAVDAEIMRHPAPPDSATFSRGMLGKWRSPRHDYLYRSDGTWSMLPAEPDATKGNVAFRRQRLRRDEHSRDVSLYNPVTHSYGLCLHRWKRCVLSKASTRMTKTSNKSIKPIPKEFANRLAPFRSKFSVFAATPCSGLFPSR